MDIKEKIDKYLDEKDMKLAKKKVAFDKVMKTIKSIKTEKQLESVMKMMDNFSIQYKSEKMIQDLVNEFEDKLDRLAHLNKINMDTKFKYSTRAEKFVAYTIMQM